MLNRLVLVASVLLWLLSIAAAPVNAGPVVDLDAPGVLDSLQRSSPAHYEKVRMILAGVSRYPSSDVARWIPIGFAAHDVDYALIVLTSHPAQRRLSFGLDGTRFVAIVPLK